MEGGSGRWHAGREKGQKAIAILGAVGFDEGSQERGATNAGCCTAATVIHTTPMGHDQEGGNEERETGRVGERRLIKCSTYYRTAGRGGGW